MAEPPQSQPEGSRRSPVVPHVRETSAQLVPQMMAGWTIKKNSWNIQVLETDFLRHVVPRSPSAAAGRVETLQSFR